MMLPDLLLNLSQLAAGSALAGICLCRLNLLGRRHRLRFRLAYCLLLTASVAAALGPWLFARPGIATLLLSVAVALHFLLPSERWGPKPPDASLTRPGALW